MIKNLNRDGSYRDSPNWIKKTTINSINKKDNKYFQYAVVLAWNHEEIKKDPQRITKTKPFINKYNREGKNFPSEKDDWKKIEKDSIAAVHNVLHAKKKKYMLLIFQNITQLVKPSYSFNGSKR